MAEHLIYYDKLMSFVILQFCFWEYLEGCAPHNITQYQKHTPDIRLSTCISTLRIPQKIAPLLSDTTSKHKKGFLEHQKRM